MSTLASPATKIRVLFENEEGAQGIESPPTRIIEAYNRKTTWQTLPKVNRRCRPGYLATARNMELVDIGKNPGCLGLLPKADLEPSQMPLRSSSFNSLKGPSCQKKVTEQVKLFLDYQDMVYFKGKLC